MTTIKGLIEFYNRSNADILVALDGDGAGVMWTVPPCSPEALTTGIKQLVRCKATKIRWIRKICIRSRSKGDFQAVAIYHLPGMTQSIYRLDTGTAMTTSLLRDECVKAVSIAFPVSS